MEKSISQMREIKFRGLPTKKSISDKIGNRFCIGHYVKKSEFKKANAEHLILDIESNQIIPIKIETLGELSGFKNNNKDDIWEGDILKIHNLRYLVVFEKGAFYLYYNISNKTTYRWGLLSRLFDPDMLDLYDKLEIIGNIHQNPELLK